MPSSETLSLVFSAVADPTRRALLHALREQPSTVTELASRFPVSLNAISKHLRVLERAHLVQRDIVGREHRISLDVAPLADAAAWLTQRWRSGHARHTALDRHLAKRGGNAAGRKKK